jgi:hypothetical protein
MTSEIDQRADEIRAIAAKPSCKTINDLAKHLGWSMEVTRHANTVLGLGLADAKLRTGPRTEARSVPKPQKAKPKA